MKDIIPNLRLKEPWLFNMDLTLIAAVSENNVIGNKGKLPWYFPEDMKRFKRLTSGSPVIMGRKTYDSIIERIGRPLPNRWNIIISKNPNLNNLGVTGIVPSIEQAIELAMEKKCEAYVIGGEQIYNQTIELANKLEITHVRGNYEGDAFFPEIKTQLWVESKREDFDKYSFVTYLRK